MSTCAWDMLHKRLKFCSFIAGGYRQKAEFDNKNLLHPGKYFFANKIGPNFGTAFIWTFTSKCPC